MPDGIAANDLEVLQLSVSEQARMWRKSGWLRRYWSGCKPVVLIMCLLATAPAVYADAGDEFMLFPQVGITHRMGLSPGSALDSNTVDTALSLFYTADYGQLRLLAEAAANEESLEVERLQFGWLIRPETTLWLGRFHSPLGYWQNQYHHGDYLQTSISRPGIAAFDHKGGPLPTHLIGLLLEGQQALGEAGLRYSVAIGSGTELNAEGLAPDPLFRPFKSQHGFAGAVRVSYHPNAYGPNEVGLFAGRNRIPAADLGFDAVEQRVSGAFFNWQSGGTRFIGAVFRVRNTLNHKAASVTALFSNGYLQVERQWAGEWALYGRLEGSSGAHDDPYLNYFSRFVEKKSLMGLRYDFSLHQALKLELANIHPGASGDRYQMLSLQWSMVYQ
ncbi:MAG TPA: hypothetical protein ENI80_08700 [Acidiferrobacteraceae bacterium]|nr:hypothetical protein [Acidiferrobacteraceae bacterium]